MLEFLRQAMEAGQAAALVLLVGIEGSASRSLGTIMAVREDGAYCGYVSGGCIESAVATEALSALQTGQDRLIRFGKGAPFFDIALPCGGGLDLLVHVLRDGAPIRAVLAQVAGRQPATLVYDKDNAQLMAQPSTAQTGWHDARFVTHFTPPVRIVVMGESLEAEALIRVAQAADVDITRRDGRRGLGEIDAHTAIAFLHHSAEGDEPLLTQALLSEAFYVGCLGGRQTQHRRRQDLATAGLDQIAMERLHGPIGLFGPARNASSLAVSVLAEILSKRA
ncbi:MAG: XdhC family protein [Alphaproteobacteria bacterium]|nr:XdhC family protein [Alphaproteobacteria bacterium]MBU1278387.1 XdhC family protein [Alphaproteobacteria bacterium]MBU1571835.1 XdhC family protein [Alphaproteobacteria bacterium]MBU1829410.1 XdhC family protein [Alphaproteobacteria bacterium]MBU2078093.1 XdhC family protein [Alphaproteobacteria bacterium]